MRRVAAVAALAVLAGCGGDWRAVPVEEATVGEDGQRLTLTVPTCGAKLRVGVRESPREVRVRVEASGESEDDCRDGISTRLAIPLGDRRLVDRTSGRTIGRAP